MIPKKFKRFKAIKGKIESEIRDISDMLGDASVGYSRYRLHKVPVDGIDLVAADAISINKYDHQSGRGCWRYLFDLKDKLYVGLGKEDDSGSYKLYRA